MVNRGLNYNDASEFIKIARKQQFTGCSGLVKIESQSNNRNVDLIILKNAVILNGEMSITANGEFRPAGETLLRIFRPLIYPGGSIKRTYRFEDH